MRRRTGTTLQFPKLPESPVPQPGADGLYRSTVIEAPFLDLVGRRLFVACGAQGERLDEGVAVSTKEVERVQKRLWDLVEADLHRVRPRLL